MVSLRPKHQAIPLPTTPSARLKAQPRREAQGTASATEPASFGQTCIPGPSHGQPGYGVHLDAEWGQNAPKMLNPALVLPQEREEQKKFYNMIYMEFGYPIDVCCNGI